MPVLRLDHVAIPTSDAERFIAFYTALGFVVTGEAAWRSGARRTFGLAFGDCKISVHPEALVTLRSDPGYRRGQSSEPGCGDICFVWGGGIASLVELLTDVGVTVIEGPSRRVGGSDVGTRIGVSVYARDPDGNLLEFISYDSCDIPVEGQ